MRVFRITRREYATDLSGEGAFLYGGRWNRKTQRMLYSSENASLALLENLAHLQGIRILPDLVLAELDLGPVRIQELDAGSLPQTWRSQPGPESLKEMGSSFLEKMEFPALMVPSVVMPRDKNLLINPLHPDVAAIKIVRIEQFLPENRLLM